MKYDINYGIPGMMTMFPLHKIIEANSKEEAENILIKEHQEVNIYCITHLPEPPQEQ